MDADIISLCLVLQYSNKMNLSTIIQQKWYFNVLYVLYQFVVNSSCVSIHISLQCIISLKKISVFFIFHVNIVQVCSNKQGLPRMNETEGAFLFYLRDNICKELIEPFRLNGFHMS